MGIDYGAQAAGLDPLLAGLTSTTLTGAIAGALQLSIPNPDYDSTKDIGPDNEPTIQPQNIFDGIYQTFNSAVLSFARLGIIGTDAWSQAQYLQRVTNLSTIIQEKGLAQALDDAAGQIFTETAISAILTMTNPITKQLFKSVGEFIQYAMNNNQFVQGSVNGAFFKELTWGDKGQYKIDVNNNYSDVTSVQIGDEIVQGTFGSVDGQWGLITGTIQDNAGQFDTDLQFQNIENGQQKYAEIKDSNGKTILVISPNGSGGYNTYNNLGEYTDSQITDLLNDENYVISNGTFSEISFGADKVSASTKQAIELKYGLTEAALDNIGMDFICTSDGTYHVLLDLNGQNTQQLGLPSNPATLVSLLNDMYGDFYRAATGLDLVSGQQLTASQRADAAMNGLYDLLTSSNSSSELTNLMANELSTRLGSALIDTFANIQPSSVLDTLNQINNLLMNPFTYLGSSTSSAIINYFDINMAQVTESAILTVAVRSVWQDMNAAIQITSDGLVAAYKSLVVNGVTRQILTDTVNKLKESCGKQVSTYAIDVATGPDTSVVQTIIKSFTKSMIEAGPITSGVISGAISAIISPFFDVTAVDPAIGDVASIYTTHRDQLLNAISMVNLEMSGAIGSDLDELTATRDLLTFNLQTFIQTSIDNVNYEIPSVQDDVLYNALRKTRTQMLQDKLTYASGQ